MLAFDNVSMPDEAVRNLPQRGRLQVVMFFDQVRSDFPLHWYVQVLGTVPDVPFIKTQVMAFVLCCVLDIPADSNLFPQSAGRSSW